MDAQQRQMMRDTHRFSQIVPCTICRAREGKPCRSPNAERYNKTGWPHRARRLAAQAEATRLWIFEGEK